MGMRAPFLETDPNVREVLAENSFLYERCAALCAGLGGLGGGGVKCKEVFNW